MLLRSIKKEAETIIGPDWLDIDPTLLCSEILHERAQDHRVLVDAVCITQTLSQTPELFFNDASFFVHACTALGTEEGTDFDILPQPNSVEMAVGITEVCDLTGCTTDDFSGALKEVILKLLKEDGYSYPVWPFNSMFNASDFEVNPATKEEWEIMKRKEEANKNAAAYLRSIRFA